MSRLTSLVGAAAIVVATAAPSHASRYDFSLASFINSEGNVNSPGFEGLSRDIGLAFQPRFGGPAATYGGAGFDVGYAVTLTDIDQNGAHWTATGVEPDDMLALSQVSVHKGLPYSFGLSATIGHLHGSGLWGIDLGTKWAFVEGYEYFPDIGLQVQVGTVVGNRDMSLLRVGAELQISKAIPLGGLLRLTPYAAYSFTFIRATSHVLGVFQEGDVEPSTNILPDQFLLNHRGVLGVRVTSTMVDVGIEAALGEIHSFGFRLGLNF
ncbi:MAG: hypothetical protein QF464_08950 [Myxococcota bacterium]|jgi:hypothetical protein|nr:hypothetical protein [Myxococcota bacterium]